MERGTSEEEADVDNGEGLWAKSDEEESGRLVADDDDAEAEEVQEPPKPAPKPKGRAKRSVQA